MTDQNDMTNIEATHHKTKAIESAQNILEAQGQQEAYEDLLQLRNELDQIDEHIINILARRFMITDMVGALKAKHSLPGADPHREAEMKEHYGQLAEEQNMNPEFVRNIFSAIMKESVSNHAVIAEKNHKTAFSDEQ